MTKENNTHTQTLCIAQKKSY